MNTKRLTLKLTPTKMAQPLGPPSAKSSVLLAPVHTANLRTHRKKKYDRVKQHEKTNTYAVMGITLAAIVAVLYGLLVNV